jgi:mevalonate kinase
LGGKSFYSNGKLLLTGEYLVLNGAKALAVPLKFGQSLNFSPNLTGVLFWKTFVNSSLWLSVELNSRNDFQIIHASDISRSDFLLKVLKAAALLNPEFAEQISSGLIESSIDFDIAWGLGSSSTLITNIAKFAGVDPFDLHDKVSKGSAYDIAAAMSEQPIIFWNDSGMRKSTNLNQTMPFKENIYFIYLGRKQNSDLSVSHYLKNTVVSDRIIEQISGLTERFIECSSLLEMTEIISSHEKLISSVIGIEPVQKSIFPDFNGSIKSLGAWGGDFIMAVSSLDRNYIKKYFNSKNLNIIFGYDEIAI